MVKKFITKTRLLAAAVVTGVAMIATGATIITNNSAARAASNCTPHADAVNIVYTGVDCGSLSADISAFKSAYNSNNSGHSASPSVRADYHDIQAVYGWAGANSGLVNGMNTNNTSFGTMYRDGRIVVNGQTVATDTWVTARFSGPSGFVHVTGNVYARKTTTSLAEASAPVLVVFNANGQVAFAAMVNCVNGLKVTPIPPAPPVVHPPVVTCDQLIFTKNSDTSYQLTARASASNTNITGYIFNFGDGQSQTVPTNATSTTVAHTYKPGNYTASVSVTANGVNPVSSAACAGQVSVPQPQAAVSCDLLSFSNNELAFNFSAKGSAQNATINSFTFDFGDGSAAKTVNASSDKASVAYTYKTSGSYTASVKVNYTDLNGHQASTSSAKCAAKVTPSQPMCTAANGKQYPVGAPECQPTMSCDQLVISNKGNDSTSLNYSFVIKASATNTTISTYSVDFGDGTPAYTGATPSIDHAYAKAGSYNIVASIMVAGQSKAITADACKGSITITPPMCTAANGKQYPVGAPECTTVPPVLPPTTPGTPLPNTGPGETIGLFTGFAIAGAAAHRIMASRRMFGLGLSR